MSTRYPATAFCDFCGASQHQRARFVAGPRDIHICDECVAIAVDLVAWRDGSEEQTKASPANFENYPPDGGRL